MVRTRVRDIQSEDISFVTEFELNEFFNHVVVTGTADDTEVQETFDQYFPGRGLIIGDQNVTVTTGTNFVNVSGTALGVGDITISGTTVSGSIVFDSLGGTSIDIDPVTNTATFVGDDNFIRTVTVASSGTIVVVSGENVTISGLGGVTTTVDSSGDEPIITVSGQEVVTTSGQVVDDEFITINRARFGYGKNGNVNGAYLRVESAASTETGHVMMRPARLTGVAAFYPNGASEKRFEVRKNGDPTTLLEVVAVEGVPTILDELSVDFDIGDRIQVFVTSSGTSVKDPNFWGEVGWRGEEA